MAAKINADASDQRSGRNRRNKAKHQERQQQDQRKIAEIGLAEDQMLDGAQIAHPRSEIEYLLAALDAPGNVAGEELPKHRAGEAIVNQPIVPAVERPHATDEGWPR